VEECVKHGTPAMAEDLDIAVDRDQEGTTLRLHGRLGIDSAPDFRDRLLVMLQGQSPQMITVDLTEVAYIDASGVATLLEALKIARQRQTRLCVKGLHGRIARLFEATGLLPVFEAGCKGLFPQLR
jgi:anti-sigma B factor antagonist